MKKVLALVVLALALMATPAMAREGFYIGVGMEYNRIVSSDLEQWQNGAGVDLKLGYNDSAPNGQAGLELDWFRTIHPGKTGYANADLSGLNINLKLYFTEAKNPNQLYLLVGYGFFKFEPDNTDTEILGKGLNLGAGFERFLGEHLALNVGVTYRFITYDKGQDSSGTITHFPELNGDTLSLHGGFNYYF